MKSLFKSNQSGEIILIILLVMAVGLTIGLAVASRSITDIRLSNQIEESSRAFSAAEAGIEEILKTGLVGSTSLSGTIGGTDYDVQLNSLSATNDIFNFPTEISEGDTQTVWLVEQKADGTGPDDSNIEYASNTITICWVDLESGVIPAVEVSLLFKKNSDGSYRIARGAFDPDNSRSGGNGFSNAQNGDRCGFTESTQYWEQINFNSFDPSVNFQQNQDIPIALRIRPVYVATKIGVKAGSGGIIPEQGKSIISTGQTGSGVERRWNVVQTYASPNDIFDYTVWSTNDLTKN